MTDKEKIRAEIEKKIKMLSPFTHQGSDTCGKVIRQLESLVSFINSLPEEPISEDLDKAAQKYANSEYDRKKPATLPDKCRGCYAPIMYAFNAGAQWQKSKLVTWLTRESDFLIQELQKGNKAYGLPEQYRAQLYKEIANKLKEE